MDDLLRVHHKSRRAHTATDNTDVVPAPLAFMTIHSNQPERPLLSICVPTYNRPDDINRLLLHLAPALLNNVLDIELCVSDNGSSLYDIDKLMLPFKTCPRVHWTKKERNEGVDQNILSAVRLATGHYVHFMGDDDSIDLNAMERLLNRIKLEQPDGVFCNYQVHLQQGHSFLAYQVRKSTQLHRLPTIVGLLGERITFMSSLIVRRELLERAEDKAALYDKKLFMHLGLTLSALSQSNKIAYHPEPIVHADDHNPSTYSVFDVFIVSLGALLSDLEDDVGETGSRQLRNSVFAYVLPQLNPTQWREAANVIRQSGYKTRLTRVVLSSGRLDHRAALRLLQLYRLLHRIRQRLTYL